MTLLTNGLLLQLAKEDQYQVQRICQPVALTAGQTLEYRSRDDTSKVYFLTSASVALLVESYEHHTLAVALIGSEGAIGLGSVLNAMPGRLHYQVQTSGGAWSANSQDLSLLLHQRPGMLWVISQYLWQLAEHVAMMAATIQFEGITTRLAYWLLLSAERTHSSRLPLTHEHLALMLGVRRVSITLAAGELKDKGLIDYPRGVVNILNMRGLREFAYPQRSTPPAIL